MATQRSQGIVRFFHSNNHTMVNTMSTQAEAGLHPQQVHGDLELIPGDPNLGEIDEEKYAKSLFNAENLTITDEGRVFVTGSLEVCEIIKVGDTYQLKKIPIETPNGSRNYFRNGITTQGDSLYLACPHIHKREFFPNLFGDIRKIDQTPFGGLLLFGLAHWDLGYQVDSYILRADLRNRENIKFTDEMPLPKKGKCFANGLVGDKNALFIANSFASFVHQNFFYKVLLSDNGNMIEVKPIAFSPPNYDNPNGLKFGTEKFGTEQDGDYLYYTCSSILKKIRISKNTDNGEESDFKAEEAIVIYQSRFSFFDDFDIVENGFVIAENGFVIADSVDFPRGSLRFVLNDRKLKGIFKDKNLINPSSVKFVKKTTELFDAGDIIIAEKGLHCVSRFRPNDEWRQWLIGSST